LQRFFVFFLSDFDEVFFFFMSKGPNAGVVDSIDIESEGGGPISDVDASDEDIDSDIDSDEDIDGGGGDPSGGDPSGGDPSGGDPSGGDPSGGDPSGGDPSGGDGVITGPASAGVSTDGPRLSGFELGVSAAVTRSNILGSSSFFSGSGTAAMII
jgi:hypothetical protein